MSLPKKINMGSFIYRVVPIQGLISEERSIKLAGLLCPNEGEIRIDSDYSPQMQGSALIHEIIHHILSSTGRDNDIKPEQIENIIDTMADGIMMLMRLNPDFVAFIGGLDDRGKSRS